MSTPITVDHIGHQRFAIDIRRHTLELPPAMRVDLVERHHPLSASGYAAAHGGAS